MPLEDLTSLKLIKCVVGLRVSAGAGIIAILDYGLMGFTPRDAVGGCSSLDSDPLPSVNDTLHRPYGVTCCRFYGRSTCPLP